MVTSGGTVDRAAVLAVVPVVLLVDGSLTIAGVEVDVAIGNTGGTTF